MNKTATILIIVAIIIIVLVLLLTQREAPQEAFTTETLSERDNTAAINQDLESIDISDIDRELQSIDADIDSL